MNDLDHWILIWRLHVCEASRLLCVPVYIHGQVWWWWYNVISHHKKKMKLFWHASMSSIFVREACYWLINKTAASRQTTKPKLHLMMLNAITLVLDKKNTWISFCHFIICNRLTDAWIPMSHSITALPIQIEPLIQFIVTEVQQSICPFRLKVERIHFWGLKANS